MRLSTHHFEMQIHSLICMIHSQICSWLKDSAGKFLQSRVDLGTSVETAEDLLMEHEEFQIRAKVYVTAVFV